MNSIQDIRLKSPSTRKLPPRKQHHSGFLAAIGVVVSVTMVAVVVWLFVRPGTSVNLNDVGVVQQKIGEHYSLPANEEPAMFTVTDKEQITTEFLKIAQNGDKVLVYQGAKRIIIYRPSTDRIIDIGPVVIAEDKQAAQ